MLIKVLTEDTPFSNGFRFEHGLSLYIETKSHKILFDIGNTNVFLDNAEKLGVDISSVDTVIISHGHYDHGGALNLLLEKNKTAKIYINKYAFGNLYNAKDAYIGLDKAFKNNKQIILTDNDIVIDDEIKILTSIKRKNIIPCNPYNLKAEIDGQIKDDNFIHEQYAIISDSGKNHLISGCSHRGIINIIKWMTEENITDVIGGFHLFKIMTDTSEGIETLNKIALELLTYNLTYYTCHCTGVEQYNVLKNIMFDKISYLSAGQVMTL